MDIEWIVKCIQAQLPPIVAIIDRHLPQFPHPPHPLEQSEFIGTINQSLPVGIFRHPVGKATGGPVMESGFHGPQQSQLPQFGGETVGVIAPSSPPGVRHGGGFGSGRVEMSAACERESGGPCSQALSFEVPKEGGQIGFLKRDVGSVVVMGNLSVEWLGMVQQPVYDCPSNSNSKS
ncbi:hypothetical protein BJ085DRAFT_27194 [Dimargaris cristalligena]|uniref:Uncharacterized protein n=1 Tax=Dimargaris cristalligena TaxID=215637 RepID=A0A4Q0A1S1_9FUNG|nr:hypothetical protein BJ085DRAFT_27194 [Dimargaris cristalligena]|eukprot:RKP40033.1 hypothetical protein BJ085DRAFT_27194 [Dimargaris cristalligena]